MLLPRRMLALLMLLVGTLVDARGIKWLVLEVQEFHVKTACLTDICRNPRFKNSLKVGSTHISSSIEINTSATNGVFDRLVSAPLKATHLDKFVAFAEVVGTDPTFNFARICDNSSVEPIINHTTHGQDSFELTLQGKCFHSKVMISIYASTCPWCIIDQASISSEEENNLSLLSTTALLIAGCSLATLVSLISTVAFICTCRLNRELASKLRRLDTSASPSTQDTESHYDLPWKNYGCRNARLNSVPYTSPKQIENLVCVSPSDQSSIEQSPFGICLGTTHLYGGHGRDDRYVAIRNAVCEDSGRDSI